MMLTNEEYTNLKAKEMEETLEMIERVRNANDPLVRYTKQMEPVLDIKHMLNESVRLYGDKIAFWVKEEEGADFYSPITYKEALDDVNALGTALIARGQKDKKIAVIGENSYEWAISYLASICGTGIVVPLDKELAVSDLKNLIITAECTCVFVTEKFQNVFKEMKDSGETSLEMIVNKQSKQSESDIVALSDLIAEGKALVESGNRDFIDAQINREEMAVILFTSGTTGVSKGVMLSHKNIVVDIMLATTVMYIDYNDTFFSVLPIHHSYECTCGFLVPLYKGASIAYCEGLKHITKNLQEAKPTVFLGVPLLFENMYNKIWQGIRKKGKEDTVKKVIKINNKTKKIGIDLGNKFFKDIRAVFGGKFRMGVCGGAAINPEVLGGLRDFGIPIIQGYGLTETSPISALNPDFAGIDSSAGRAIPTTQAKIIDADPETGIGEICLAGPHVMLGYYQRPDLTEESLIDGWYHTGDLGKIDDKGYIYITGRKKNVIITKNGKNVYPEEIEYHLLNVPYVLETMVWEKETSAGEDTMIVASIIANEEEVAAKLGENYSDEDLEKLLWVEIDKINTEQPFYKRIKKVILRKEEFIKSTSKKIKRHVAENKE